MPKKRNSKRKRQLVNQRFVKALAHELRVEILGILTERMASPNELATMLGEGLSSVSYHVSVLKDYECINLVKTEPRRGAVEHFYRATSSTLLPAAQWRGIGGGLRTVVGAGLASDLFNDLADAVDANKLTEADTRIGRMLLVLDAQAWKNVRASAERFSKEVEREQRASAARVAKANGSASAVKGYTVGVLAFQDSRDLSKEKVQRGRRAGTASNNGKKATAKGKGKGTGRTRKGSRQKTRAAAK